MSKKNLIFVSLFISSFFLSSCQHKTNYTIIWENYNKEVLEVDYDVPYGTIPSYDGEVPKRIADDQHSYIFSGWSPNITLVTSDAIYTAQFNKIPTLGIYPQTEVSDETLISTLNTKSKVLPSSSNNQSWTSYHYYIESSNETDFMWYQDISIEDELYRGVYFSSYRPNWIPTNESYSYQDDNNYFINTRYWFKFEPIIWDVLSNHEDEEMLLLASKILDSQEYYHLEDERNINEQIVYPNNYQESNIRKWLNNYFYNTAFKIEEQTCIATSKVNNDLLSTKDETNDYICEDTYDKLFLLSNDEATNEDYDFSNNTARIRQATDYAKAMGVFVSTLNENSFWLTRSPFNYSSHLSYVVSDSGSFAYSYINNTSSGILPALRLNYE